MLRDHLCSVGPSEVHIRNGPDGEAELRGLACDDTGLCDGVHDDTPLLLPNDRLDMDGSGYAEATRRNVARVLCSQVGRDRRVDALDVVVEELRLALLLAR